MLVTTFRTVKYDVATLVAGMPPIVELIQEDHRCHERRRATGGAPAVIHKEERAETFRKWEVILYT
ncbi:reverse transcriptase [Anopheles sinensis]|uniref:Reverse transcriptase n=1 Tax=Anopheles sinensis TaxID=74873 RepID=A0A084WPE1_ANOSI|nr:reverse transcriptase [Anopheles sinensis]